MATTQAGNKTLKTPMFRASFPEVFQKRAFQEGQQGRYSVVGLFTGFPVQDGETVLDPEFKAPKAWKQADKDRWNAIIDSCNRASVETFKKPMHKLQPGTFKIPLHRGEEKTYKGYGPGTVYFTMASTKRKPEILDRNGENITPDTVEEFYAGCWAIASVNPYAFTNIGKGIAIGLGNLLKVKDGERLDAFTSANEDFGADPSEFVGDDEGSDSEDDPTA